MYPVHTDIPPPKPPHNTDINKTKQVRNKEEPWILSLLWLHHLFLRWEVMERRAVTLLHIRHVIYTALDPLGQQRKTGFLRQCFRKSSATAGIRITGHGCWDPPVSFTSTCRFSCPSSCVIIGTHSTQSANWFSDLTTAGAHSPKSTGKQLLSRVLRGTQGT